MRLLNEQPRTMSSGSSNFLLVPIPEYPVLDCVPNKNVKIVVLGASNVGKTGKYINYVAFNMYK